jgi:hypothetical protein
MDNSPNNLTSWFAHRPKWLQDAARRIILKGEIDSDDLTELITLCKQEAGIEDSKGPKLTFQEIPQDAFQRDESDLSLHLKQISNIIGINALAPRKPLTFGEGPMAIIYGGTGSGKSGYVRILKHACGAKKPGILHSNIFDRQNSKKSCTFEVMIDSKPKELEWAEDVGILDDIRKIEIYDTDCAHVYLTEENEVAYEPWALSLFSELTTVCKLINEKLKNEIDLSFSKTSSVPTKCQDTNSASWYSKLSHYTKQQDIDIKCKWNPSLEKELVALNKRLSETDPAQKAKELRKTKANLLSLHDKLEIIRDKLTDEKCSAYLDSKKDAATKRKAADKDAIKVFENVPLDGVGSETWRLLWEQARLYSEKIAYKDIVFPNISEEARCVLCQQLLDLEAKQRFGSFENFVKGELQNQAIKAETNVKTLKEDIDGILSAKEILLYINSAGITNEDERNEILKFYALMIKRKNALLKAESLTDVKSLPEKILFEKLKAQAEDLKKQAEQFDKDAKKENRKSLENQAKELEAQKWLSEQKSLIEEEVKRLVHVHALTEARKLTYTRKLSDKKSDLTDELISPAFIKRFEDELKTLGADRIKVQLVKTRTEYGRVYHRIILKNCVKEVCTTEILSEGEFRIVSLAAFLADVEGPTRNTPFIFDDPISSLDQDYEEATCKRLIELCQNRQVIVFTHRLSLLALLEDLARKNGVEPSVICLRNESWGAGEPGETLINEKRPNRALNYILNNRLPGAKKIYNEVGRAEYEESAKGICRDIRILIERIIENDLLSDMIQRFRRQVQTKNKIHNLAKINADDCKLLDDYMTEYSKYEHSQPYETPAPMPEPDKIESDLTNIITWLYDFKAR